VGVRCSIRRIRRRVYVVFEYIYILREREGGEREGGGGYLVTNKGEGIWGGGNPEGWGWEEEGPITIYLTLDISFCNNTYNAGQNKNK